MSYAASMSSFARWVYPQRAPSVTLVTEAYNLAEGQSEASFVAAVAELERITARRRNVEIAVIDPSNDNIAAPVLARRFPAIAAKHLPGYSYDGQKNAIGHQSQSEFVVFLDGDCKPAHDDWLDRILSPLSDPDVPAVSGLTLYDDFTATGIAMTILDFGFLFEPRGASLGCYVSNNVAFRRSALLHHPIPDEGILRSFCYKHAQILLRAGTPVRFEPKALVLHELPDIAKERHRRGYDHVAALWADPALDMTPLIANTDAFIAHIVRQNTKLALDRLRAAPKELGAHSYDAATIEDTLRSLLKLEESGIRAALEEGEANGFNARARETHGLAKASKP